MGEQGGLLAECIAADGTCVRTPFGVDGLVLVEIVLTGEKLSARGTGMGTDFQVDGADVAAQCDVRAKGFGAGVAFERAFVRVNANVIGQGSGIGHLPVTM